MRPRALLRCAPASTKDETEADELRHETQQLNHAIDSLNGVGFRGARTKIVKYQMVDIKMHQQMQGLAASYELSLIL